VPYLRMRSTTTAADAVRSRRSATASKLRSSIVTRTCGSFSRLRAQSASGSPAATRIEPSTSWTKPTATATGWPLVRPVVSMRATLPQAAS